MKKIEKKDLRQFGIVLGIIFGIFGGIHFLKAHTHVYPWFFVFAGITLFLGIFVPQVLRPVYTIFIKIAHAIGWVNTRIILILVYYFILTPTGFLMKVFRKDSLERRIDKSIESYWIRRSAVTATKESLEKQF